MPIEVLPLTETSDLQINAVFFERLHEDLFMVANFANLYTNNDLPMLGTFFVPSTNDLVQVAIFKIFENLNMTATFLHPYFISSLPMNVVFYTHSSTNDLLSTATFYTNSNLNMNSNFIRFQNSDMAMYASFINSAYLDMTATFLAPSTNDIVMTSFLGTLNSLLPMESVFFVPGLSNFNSTIVIQAYVAPKGVIFLNTQDFLAQIYIKGITNSDFSMYANFDGKSPNDFLATMQITNSYIGGGGVPVTISGGAIPITVTSDSTGYFHIGNLQPGTYIITPKMTGITFTPSMYQIIISNSNVTLYFNADGSFKNETFTPVPLPPNPTGTCVVIPNNGAAGTFSIDGYILTGDFGGGQSILVTSVNENEATQFRQTFSRNIGEGS